MGYFIKHPYDNLYITTRIFYNSYCCCTVYFTHTEKDRTTYSDLLHYLQDVDDWQTLGANILPGEPSGLIKIIHRTYNGDVRECKKELFIEYMRNGDRSWKTVISALIKLGNKNLAGNIKQKVGL